MDIVIEEAARCGLRWGRPDGVPVSRKAVVAETRSWIGTPFMHQHSVKGHGVDCGGLVRGISVALGLIPSNYRDLVPIDLRGYSQHPHGDLGLRLCDHYWQRINQYQMRPGDVVLVRWGSNSPPSHSAIVADYLHGGLSMIHALGPGHPCKVIENSMRWLEMSDSNGPKLVAAYSLPGVE